MSRFVWPIIGILLAFAPALMAGGTTWRLVTASGDTLDECRLAAVDDSLATLQRYSGSMTVPLSAITLLVRRNETHMRAGGGLGLLAGVVIGAFLAGAVYPGNEGDGMRNMGQALGGLGVLVVSAVGGMVCGSILGAVSGIDSEYWLADSTRAAKAAVIRREMSRDSR